MVRPLETLLGSQGVGSNLTSNVWLLIFAQFQNTMHIKNVTLKGWTCNLLVSGHASYPLSYAILLFIYMIYIIFNICLHYGGPIIGPKSGSPRRLLSGLIPGPKLLSLLIASYTKQNLHRKDSNLHSKLILFQSSIV